MALVNPNIAMSFRAPEIQQPNMLADYAAIQQIQGGQQAQQLNALKIQEYERARGEEEGARNFLRGRDLASPDTRTGLTQFGKTGLALAKSLSEQDAATLSMQNVKSQISERDFGLQDKKLKFAWGAVGDAATPELAIQKITDGIKDGVFKPQDGAAEIQQLQGMTPDGFKQYRVNKVLQLLDAKDKLVTMLPKIARQEAGGQIVSIQDNPALPGYGLPITGVAPIVKTATIGERTAQGQLAVSQGQLGVAQQRAALDVRKLAQDSDPAFVQKMAQAREAGVAAAKDINTATRVLPQVVSTANQTLSLIDTMIGKRDDKGNLIKGAAPHPGFEASVGATLTPGMRFVPGSDASDFQSYFDQVKGGAFLQAFETLKGGGAITEKEGEKGTAALNRMNLAQSEKEFVTAAREFQSIVRAGVERAQAKVPGASRGSAAAPAAGGVKFLGFE
jgi:hypothetical protein